MFSKITQFVWGTDFNLVHPDANIYILLLLLMNNLRQVVHLKL